MSDVKTIFVTGGTGFVGAHLVRALVNRGDRVLALCRESSDRSLTKDLSVEWVVGDLVKPETFEKHLRGCQAVFHCAADYRLFSRNTKPMYRTNVEGTRSLLEACRRYEVPKIVYTSSVAALQVPSPGYVSTESSTTKLANVVGHYKKSKFLAQEVALEMAADGVPVTIVNPSTPIGPGDIKPTATGRIIVDFLNRKMPAYLDTGLNLVAVEDVARGHLLAEALGKPGELYILGNLNLSLKEILEMLASVTGLPAPKVQIPYGLAWSVGLVDTLVEGYLMGRHPQVPLEGVKMARKKMFFDPSKAREELGFETGSVREAWPGRWSGLWSMGMLRRRWALLASLVRPPTLAQITLAALAITCCLIGLLYFQLSEASKNALDKSASLLVELKQTQDRVRSDVRSFFESGESLLKEIDDEGMTELLKAPDSELLVFLEGKMQESPHFSEFTFTWPDGQVSVKREPTGGLRGERKDGPESAAHRTYSTLAMPRLRGREIWSDLYFSNDLDKGLSEQQVVMSVQKAIWRDGQLIGVAKVALTADRLNDVKKLNSASGWLFLSDTDGGLLTQVSDGLELVEGEDSIRYSATQAPLPVQRALRLLRGSQEEDEEGDLLTRVNLDGEKYIVSFTPLKGSQDWLVGTVWTESYFLTALKENQNRTLLVSALVLTAIFALFVGTLRRINRDLYRLVEACQGMTELDFSASHESYSLRETARLSDSLEGAKATLRAASKYAPLDLIRKLFSQDLAPELGGETREVTIVFTDVADFTSVSEKLSTNELAQALANYLAQMSAGILGHEGAILERVGDALLAVWNAPSTIENQSLKACLAALACIENTRENSWRTRIGIHRDEVMVGHFGSEKRMNYGVLGDGVNLASRVEGLNKHYGTSILATASVVEACGDNLVFRAVDRVVVKGREKSIELFELLGERGAAFPESHLNLKTSYEEALGLYRESRFEEASKLWSRLSECDPVSTVMCERAKQFAGNPPDKNWDGVFRASFK